MTTSRQRWRQCRSMWACRNCSRGGLLIKQTTCFDFMGRSIRITRRPPRRAPVAASFSLPPPFGQQQQRRAVRREHGDDRAWRRLRRSPIDTNQPGGAVTHNAGREKPRRA